MRLRRNSLLLGFAWTSCLLIAAAIWLFRPFPQQTGLRAQSAPTPATVTGWNQRIPYEPPNSRQVKTEISGTEAETIPDSGGKIRLKGVRIKQFPVTGGDPQMVATAPECVADRKLDAVSSAGPLQVHAQGDKFFVEGVGFLLRQAESTLWISNQVHSIIRNAAGTNSPSPVNTEIFSHRARFEMKGDAPSGFATYEENVWVNDPRLKLTCEYLLAELPRQRPGETNRANHIVAETNVVIDFLNTNGEHTLAAGQKAVYDHKLIDGVMREILVLTGSPRIEMSNGWMSADVFEMDRVSNAIHGHGHFHFHYFGQNEAPAAKKAPAGDSGAPETDIFSDNFQYDVNSRLANFTGHVHAKNEQMKLDCETLVATLPKPEPGKPGRLDHIVADTNVRIDFVYDQSGATNHATSQKAVYDYKVNGAVTNELLELTGNPSVELTNPQGWMTADVIRADRAHGKVWGLGNQHSVFKKQSDEPVTMDTEIFSDRFEFTQATGIAVYTNDVRAYDPEMNLVSEIMTIKLAKSGEGRANRIDRVNAQGNVSLDFLDKAFAPKDITNLTAFAARLKKPGDVVSRFVASQLAPQTVKLLSKYENGTNTTLQSALADDLNRLVQRGPVYEPDRFAGVYLSPDTGTRMERHPLGVDLIELNRLLLLDAFRGQIARNQDGELTHGTGDTANYTYKAVGKNAGGVLKLSGNPKLEQPQRWITAEKSIVFDRATGVAHAIGDSHVHMIVTSSARNRSEGGRHDTIPQRPIN